MLNMWGNNVEMQAPGAHRLVVAVRIQGESRPRGCRLIM